MPHTTARSSTAPFLKSTSRTAISTLQACLSLRIQHFSSAEEPPSVSLVPQKECSAVALKLTTAGAVNSTSRSLALRARTQAHLERPQLANVCHLHGAFGHRVVLRSTFSARWVFFPGNSSSRFFSSDFLMFEFLVRRGTTPRILKKIKTVMVLHAAPVVVTNARLDLYPRSQNQLSASHATLQQALRQAARCATSALRAFSSIHQAENVRCALKEPCVTAAEHYPTPRRVIGRTRLPWSIWRWITTSASSTSLV